MKSRLSAKGEGVELDATQALRILDGEDYKAQRSARCALSLPAQLAADLEDTASQLDVSINSIVRRCLAEIPEDVIPTPTEGKASRLVVRMHPKTLARLQAMAKQKDCPASHIATSRIMDALSAGIPSCPNS